MKFFFTLLLLMTTTSTLASLILEPYYGGSAILSDNMSVYPDYGGRAGFSFGKFLLGVDYGLAKFEDTTTSASRDYTDEFSRKKTSVFVSYYFDQSSKSTRSFFLPSSAARTRLWLSYVFDVQDKVTSSGGLYQRDEILKGTGFEVGMGNKLFSIISGYIACRNIRLDEIKGTTGTTRPLSGNNVQSIYEIEVGIGLPIAFF